MAIEREASKKQKITKIIYYFVCVFIASLVYNAVFVPNNIIIGGVSGLAIIVKEMTGLSTTIFIDVANVLLIILSFVFLSKKEAIRQLMGCIVYPIMITLTEPVASLINIEVGSKLLLYLIAASIYGVCMGLIYRAEYSTGGFDILTQIFSNRLKKPITAIGPVLNISVLVLGILTFNPVQIMYSIMVIFISNKVTNAVLFSVSTSKMVYVISEKNKDIKDYIMDDINMGATEVNVHSGLFEKKKQMLICVLHNAQYVSFKHRILKMDPNAFILSKKCYEVSGGSRLQILPF